MARSFLFLCFVFLVTPALAEQSWSELRIKLGQRYEATPFGDVFPQAMAMSEKIGHRMSRAPLQELMDTLEEARGLKFKHFVPWHVKDRDELAVFFARQMELYYPPEQSRLDEGMLKHLGLVEADFEIRPFMQELFTEQIAGAYDPDTREFFVVDVKQDILTRALSGQDAHKILIFHELDHALGDQYFDLKKLQLEAVKAHNTDMGMARSAVFEGEATLVMFDYQAISMGLTPQDDGVSMAAMADWLTRFPIPLPGMGGFHSAPLYFKRALIFPYYNGMDFVRSVRRLVGWRGVDALYTELPRSTEQILHPEKFLYLIDEPKPVTLGQFPKNINGWQAAAHDDTGGEFLVSVFLEQNLGGSRPQVAYGWGGDRYRLYNKDDRTFLVWLTVWDSQSDAGQFEQALADLPEYQVHRKGAAVLLGHDVPADIWSALLQKAWK